MSAGDSNVWIAETAFAEMLQLAKQHAPLETGGMLLGYEVDSGAAVVTKVIGPGPKAKHGLFRFTPDGKFQQAELENHYWATEGRETYLGDWHTHPKSDNSPSTLDKRTLARIAQEPASRTNKPLMAILAGGSGEWDLGVVRFLSMRKRIFWTEYELTNLTARTFKDKN
jgi:integrative and conjugative element protein (TIGR02256 family)